jgi:ribulose 1,5-bisphosphate carboxylase large subunit-like protein
MGRPLIGTIIKPSIGLTPDQTAAMVGTLVEAGSISSRTMQLMADPLHSPFDARVEAIMRVINAHADRTGKKAMYAFNISDELDAMTRHYDKVVAAGGTAAMVSVNSVGLAATKKICDCGLLAIHGHRNGWVCSTAIRNWGWTLRPTRRSWRLAGVDQLHVNGIGEQVLGTGRFGRGRHRVAPCSRARWAVPVFPWSHQDNGVARLRRPGGGRRPLTCSIRRGAGSWRIPMALPPACMRCGVGGKRPSRA